MLGADELPSQTDILCVTLGWCEAAQHVHTMQASFFGKSDGHGHSLVYYFGLPEGWEPSMIDNAAALALWQRFVHDGTEHDG